MGDTRRWLISIAFATVGLLLLWAYVARPVGRSTDSAAAQTRASATTFPALASPGVVTLPAPVPVTAPSRLRLVDQAITARVDVSGLASDGSMVIPQDPSVIGWYSRGALPGAARGSMVLAGHINSRASGPGVLAALAKAKVGDTVVVQLTDGRGFAYRVSQIEQFHKRSLPLATIFDDAGPHQLTLLTCYGRFLGSDLGYEDNLVVTATPIG